jgi:hypothetical protein
MLVNYKANCFASNLKKLSCGLNSLTKVLVSGMWFILVGEKKHGPPKRIYQMIRCHITSQIFWYSNL